MEEKKDFLDELSQNVMLVALIIGAVCSLCGFFAQFFSAETMALFQQLSYYAFGWMVFVALGPTVKRAAFMKVDLLVNALYPEAVKNALKLLCDLVLFALIVVLFVFSIMNFTDALASGTMNEAAPVIPVAIAYLASVVGYGLGVIAYIMRALGAKGGEAA